MLGIPNFIVPIQSLAPWFLGALVLTMLVPLWQH